MAEQAADRRAAAAAARVLVGGDDVGLHEIVGRLDLAAADVGAGLQLAVVGHRPFHRAAAHGAAPVDEGEALRVLHEDLDDRLGAAEVVLAPPLIVGLDDRQRAEPLGADRDLALRVELHLVGGAGAGVAGLGRSGNGIKRDRGNRRGESHMTHDLPP
jgi:hypothetical protein